MKQYGFPLAGLCASRYLQIIRRHVRRAPLLGTNTELSQGTDHELRALLEHALRIQASRAGDRIGVVEHPGSLQHSPTAGHSLHPAGSPEDARVEIKSTFGLVTAPQYCSRIAAPPEAQNASSCPRSFLSEALINR